MLFNLPAALVALVALATSVQAAVVPTPTATVNLIREKDLSNAERLARGMPLKAPSRRYDPTRPHVFQARASELPLQAIIQRTFPDKRTYGQYLRYQAADGVFDLTSKPSKATVFTLPGDGPVTTGYEAVNNLGQYLALQGEGPLTSPLTWVANLTYDSQSDGGYPVGKDYQTSVFGIDGLGSPVKGSYFVDTATTIDARFFFDNECRVVTSANPELDVLLGEIDLVWAPVPEP